MLTTAVTSQGLRRIVLVLIGMIAIALATPASPVQASVRTTHLTLTVTGCKGCRIGLEQAHGEHEWKTSLKKIGTLGRVSFTIPRSRTRGMSFNMSVPWEAFDDAALNVATRYVGQKVGARWSAAKAVKSKRGYGCWAGTKRRSTTLHFHVARYSYRSQHLDGTVFTATGAVAWASPGLSTLNSPVRTFHGSVENQDAFFC